MTTYWAIAIGINQYRGFQPLMYAQRDAQALWSYWASEGHFSPEHCLLLTDASAMIDQSAWEPDRNTLESTLESVCRQLQPEDVFWCFFSGYGVRFQGHDYLMPVDGDPQRVPETGIPLESVFGILKAALTHNIVLVLDINRSQGALGGEGVGQETIALAQQFGIPTLLSCPPHQFSHETLALRQGLFTAALLEGLRFQGCATVGQLAHYVSDRLPELSEHHCRPRQDSLAIVPAAQQHLLLVPEQALVMAGMPYSPKLPQPTADIKRDHDGFSDAKNPIKGSAGVQLASQNGDYAMGNGSGVKAATIAMPPAVPRPTSVTPTTDDGDALFWKRWRPWMFGAIALLIVAVLLQNRQTFSNQPLPQPAPTSGVVPNPGSITAQTFNPAGGNLEGNTADPTAPTEDEAAIAPDQAPLTDPAIDEAMQGNAPDGIIAPIPEESPIPADATVEPDSTVAPIASPSPSVVAPSPAASASPNPALQSVRAALQAQQYETAARQLEQIPVDQRTGDYAALLQQMNQGLLRQARASLSRPRALSATNQASDFSTAIQIASRIKPGTPFHAEAQQDIDRWSQIILELARSRASQPNGGSALVAAQNYNTAIRAAGLVPAHRTQLHSTAQQYIAQWSQTMMTLASARAREGRLDVAIRTARLVPRNTPSHAAAERAIAQWEAQLYY